MSLRAENNRKVSPALFSSIVSQKWVLKLDTRALDSAVILTLNAFWLD